MTSTPAAVVQEPTRVARRYARYALGLLLLVYVVNYVDRQVLSILLEPIRKEPCSGIRPS